MKDKLVLPCLRFVLGDWVIYSSAMSAGQINERITTDKKYRENPELDNILQRGLKFRKEAIAKYLLTNNSRFFNSIIVGVFDGLPQWHEFSVESKLDEIDPRDKEEVASVGLLEFMGDEEMFAVDGQHRVAGIQIAYQNEMTKLEATRELSNDKFSVIFIAHIDDVLGRKRTRKLFSDINKNAKKVEEGDTIKIDEEDLSAIITRRIYTQYIQFQGIIALTETAKLENDDKENFTNLLGLNTVSKQLKRLYKKDRGTYEWDEVNVSNFYNVVEQFWNIMIDNIGDYKSYFYDQTLTIKEAREHNMYLLFRPIGLKILSKLYVHFLKKYDKSTSEFLSKINALNFYAPNSIFNSIIWNKGRIDLKHSSLAYSLALYILDEYPGDVEELLKDYRSVRKDDTVSLPNINV